MSTSSESKIVSINDLKIGMFVEAIARQKSNNQLTRSGLITKKEQIIHLKKIGVDLVKVDYARSKLADAISVPIESSSKKKPPSSVQQQQIKANRLFNEAKSMQSKYFRELAKGEPIDFAPMEQTAGAMIDSLGDNSEAMLFLARIREKDKYLMEHSLNVGMLLAHFARFIGMPKKVQSRLLMGGMLHDIGKTMTPDHILHKPAKLTDDEFLIMREHVVHSRKILEKQPGIDQIVLEVAANHHERVDGKGYPLGLKGEQLGIYSRMSNIVDVYDALTADRVYKSGMPPTSAFRILLKGVGSQFDKALLEKFIRCMGVYPVGTLVKLASGKLGIVMQRNELKPLRPVLKVIFNAKTNMHAEVKLLDLHRINSEEIVEAVSARDYGLSLDDYTEL